MDSFLFAFLCMGDRPQFPNLSVPHLHNGYAAEHVRKVFYLKIDFASFKHLQSCKLQAKAYRWNHDKTKASTETVVQKHGMTVMLSSPKQENKTKRQLRVTKTMWPVQLGRADHRYWSAKHVACFIFKRFTCSISFVRLFLSSAPFQHIFKTEQTGISSPCRRDMRTAGLMFSLWGICLPCSASMTLRWFRLHIPTFQQQVSTRGTQLNLFAKCFTREFISRNWSLFSDINYKQTLSALLSTLETLYN